MGKFKLSGIYMAVSIKKTHLVLEDNEVYNAITTSITERNTPNQ
jgi:hypothetical protein